MKIHFVHNNAKNNFQGNIRSYVHISEEGEIKSDFGKVYLVSNKKDALGVEIKEGDIVEHTATKLKYDITFDGSCFYLMSQENDYDGMCFNDMEKKFWNEVVVIKSK